MTIFVVLPLKGFWEALWKFGAKFAGHPSYNFSWDRFVTGIMQLDCGRVIFILTVFWKRWKHEAYSASIKIPATSEGSSWSLDLMCRGNLFIFGSPNKPQIKYYCGILLFQREIIIQQEIARAIRFIALGLRYYNTNQIPFIILKLINKKKIYLISFSITII